MKLVPPSLINHKIYIIRGQNVMFDKDLANLYGVQPIRLREQVKRNKSRFPKDFMFQLNEKEIDFMVSQNAIPSRKYLGGHRPYVFTEQGVAMLSSILNSERAIHANIAIMRAFVKLRKILGTHKILAKKFNQLEKRMNQKDKEVKVIFEAIRKLMDEPVSHKKK